MRLLLILFLLIYQNAFAFRSSEFLNDSESAFLRSDFFLSYRYYTLALERAPNAFNTNDIENYVITMYHLLPLSELKKFCNNNISTSKYKSDFSFYCGKTFLHAGDYVASVEFLEKVPKELHRLEYHFVKGSAYLKISKSQDCIQEMNIAKKKISANTSDRFKDVINVLHARCLLAQNLYKEALAQYQKLDIKSIFYFTTLEEQAWAHFKLRNLIASREILNILINYFTSRASLNTIFDMDVYFRVRYLQGYIELISENSEKSRKIFLDLNEEIKSYMNENLSKNKISKSFIDELKKLNSLSMLTQAQFKKVREIRDFIGVWNSQVDVSVFDNDIRYLISINLELNRIKRIKIDAGEYEAQLEKLRNKQVDLVIAKMRSHLFRAQSNMDSILFKSSMGQVENVWAQRTEGKRTLAEVLEIYQSEVNQVEDYVSK